MAILLFSCLTLIFTLLAYAKRSRFFQFVLQFLPFCFVFFFLWAVRGQYEILQVRKLGYEFEKVTNDYRAPARNVVIGGNQDKDDLFSQKLPATAVKIVPSLTDNSLNLQVLTDGVLILRNGEPLNETMLHDSDRIEIAGTAIQYHARGSFSRSFTAANEEWKWPRDSETVGKMKKPSFATGFHSQMHTLSEIGEALKLTLQSKGAVYLDSFHTESRRRPLQINAVGIVGTSNIRINGATLPDKFPIANGDIIAVYAIALDENGAHADQAFGFRIQNGESLSFFHTNPPVVGMKEELLRGGSNVDKPLLITTTTLPYSAFPTVQYGRESDRFNRLSAFVQLKNNQPGDGVFSRMRDDIAKLLAIQQQRMEVVSDDGIFHPDDLQPFALGKSEKILFSLHQVRFPWQLLQIFLLLVVLKVIFQPPFFASVENRAAQLILITVDFFLAIRFLFAFRADSLFPFSDKALDLSLLAWLLLPYVFFAAALCKRTTWDRPHALNFVLYSAAMVAITTIVLPHHLILISMTVMLAAIVAFLKFHPRSLLPQLQLRLEFLRNAKVDVFSLLLLGVALVLYFAGAGEALRLGSTRIPLSLLYHPAFLLLSCKYLLDLCRMSEGEKSEETLKQTFRLLLKSGLLFGQFLLISFLMADLGFFLLYCIPILFLFFGAAVLLVSEYELKWKLAGVVAAVPLVLIFVGLFSTSTIEGILPHSYVENRYVQRILLAVDPTALEESGLIAAERQLGHQRTFLAYAHGGLRGAGYMQHPISSALSATALNDNVPSVFLLNDFGIFGAAGVLLVLLLWIWLWMKSRPDPGLTYQRLLSFGALVTIVFVDIYMILSNCGIFLFTGKNVFLWGLNSTSDLLHSAILLTLLIVPIAQIPETSYAPAELELPLSFVGELKRV